MSILFRKCIYIFFLFLLRILLFFRYSNLYSFESWALSWRKFLAWKWYTSLKRYISRILSSLSCSSRMFYATTCEVIPFLVLFGTDYEHHNTCWRDGEQSCYEYTLSRTHTYTVTHDHHVFEFCKGIRIYFFQARRIVRNFTEWKNIYIK